MAGLLVYMVSVVPPACSGLGSPFSIHGSELRAGELCGRLKDGKDLVLEKVMALEGTW